MQNIKRIIVPILLVSILVISGSIYASDVTDAKYLSTIRVTNNSTSPITDGIVVFDLSTAEMITSSMLNASASDCALLTGIGGSDLAFQPSVNSTYPWVAWVNSIRANAELYEYLYSKDATGGKISYFPGDAGMTVLDTLTEPLSNFSLRINNAYINTDASANKTLLSHYDTLAGGIRVYVSPTVSQNITATIYSYSSAVCLSYVGGDYLNRAAGVVMPSGGEITVEVLAYILCRY